MEKGALKGMFASGNMPAGAEYKAALTDILQTFPYFQLAQVLFAKQMYDTHEPEASGLIKLASVYAPDRKAMYLLFKSPASDTRVQPIKSTNPGQTDIPKNQDKPEIKYNYIYSSSAAKNVEVNSASTKVEIEATSPLPAKEPSQTEVFIRKELEAKAPLKPEAEKATPIETSKVEIVKPETKKTEAITPPPAKKSIPQTTVEKEKKEQIIIKATVPPPVEKIPTAIDIKLEEKKPEAEKDTIVPADAPIEENKKPETQAVVPVTVNEPISDTSLKYSFNSWLKVIPEISIANEEPVRPVSQKDKASIIDTFLKNAPSISRPKAEFFSSVKAAKMSIVEDDNLVSETLAKIYFEQGNLNRALKAYQTLLTRFPEKKNIFAPRIEEIKALMRENNKSQTK